MKKSDTPKCMTPGCKRVLAARGLCRACYNAANSLVNNGRGTWDEFVRLGLCKTPHDRARASNSSFAKNFNAITANKEARP